MPVTITTNTLSPRVRYLNISPSTINADARDVVLALANALVDLGWSRFDTPGGTSIIGTDDNAGVILRRPMSDFAQSGYYNYLGLRLVGTSNNTYTLHVIQAANWTSTTSMTAFVSGATGNGYTPNTTGDTRFLNFGTGGTIWMFDSEKTLLLTSQSGDKLIKDLGSILIISEYKKEFGENVNAATGFIHNGVFTNDRWLFDGCGIMINPSVGSSDGHTGIHGFLGASTNFIWSGARVSTTTSTNITSQAILGNGAAYSQFTLTQAPTVVSTTQGSVTSTRAAGAPAAVVPGFTTRLLMGYMGYIGHLCTTRMSSIFSEFVGMSSAGHAPTTFKHSAASLSLANGGLGTGNTFNLSFSSRSTNVYPLLNSIEEYSPSTLPTNLKFTVFEPTLSCGTTNGLSSTNTGGNTNTYTGPQFKFSLLGRMFDLKIFGPYSAEKYSFLDSITIPCGDEGFYQEGGTNKDFWLIPSSNHLSFVMPK